MMHQRSFCKITHCYVFLIILVCGTLPEYSDGQTASPDHTWDPTVYSNYTSKYSIHGVDSHEFGFGSSIIAECDTRILTNFTRDMASGYTSEDPVPPDYINKEKAFQYGSKAVNNEWGDFLDQYPLVKLIVILILILAILIPLIGLIFWCRRRAGRCGAHSDSCDKKNDRAKRLCCSILLLLLVLCIIPFLIYAFLSYFYLLKGLKELQDGKYGIEEGGHADSDGYDPIDKAHDVERTKKHIDRIFHLNFGEFEEQLENNIRDQLKFIVNEGKKKNVDNAKLFMKTYSSDIAKVNKTIDTLLKFIDKCMELEDGVRFAKRSLINAISACPGCSKPFIDAADDFVKLDLKNPSFDMVEFIYNLKSLRSGLETMKDSADNATKNYYVLERRVYHVQQVFPDETIALLLGVKSKLMNIGTEMKKEIEAIYEGKTDLKSLRRNPDQIPRYVLIFGFIVCLIILLILICVIVAVVCGIFGKRRNENTSKCCDRYTASRLLILAAYLIFIFFTLIALTLLIYLLLGTAAYRAICYSLNDRVVESAPIENNTSEGNFSCPYGKNIYQALRETNRFRDIKEINKFDDVKGMNEKLSGLADALGYDGNDTYLIGGYEKNLLLNDPWHEITMKEYDEKLNPKEFFAIEIKDVLAKINAFGNIGNETTQSIVKAMIKLLTAMKDKVLAPMMAENLPKCREQIIIIANMKYDGQTPVTFSKTLVKQLDETEKYIQNNMKDLAKKINEIVKKNYQSDFRIYLERTVALIENQVGVCRQKRHAEEPKAQEIPADKPAETSEKTTAVEPFSATAKPNTDPHTYMLETSTITSTPSRSITELTPQQAVCYCIVDPMNAFWWALLLCLLFLLPILLLIPFLAYLYRKPCPYGDPAIIAKGKVCECNLDDLDGERDYDAQSHKIFKPNDKVKVDCKLGRTIVIHCDPKIDKDKASGSECECKDNLRLNSKSVRRQNLKCRKVNQIGNATQKKFVLLGFHRSRKNDECETLSRSPKLTKIITIKCDSNESENKTSRSLQSIDDSDNNPSGSGCSGNTQKRTNCKFRDREKQPRGNRKYEDRPSGSKQCK